MFWFILYAFNFVSLELPTDMKYTITLLIIIITNCVWHIYVYIHSTKPCNCITNLKLHWFIIIRYIRNLRCVSFCRIWHLSSASWLLMYYIGSFWSIEEQLFQHLDTCFSQVREIVWKLLNMQLLSGFFPSFEDLISWNPLVIGISFDFFSSHFPGQRELDRICAEPDVSYDLQGRWGTNLWEMWLAMWSICQETAEPGVHILYVQVFFCRGLLLARTWDQFDKWNASKNIKNDQNISVCRGKIQALGAGCEMSMMSCDRQLTTVDPPWLLCSP